VRMVFAKPRPRRHGLLDIGLVRAHVRNSTIGMFEHARRLPVRPSQDVVFPAHHPRMEYWSVRRESAGSGCACRLFSDGAMEAFAEAQVIDRFSPLAEKKHDKSPSNLFTSRISRAEQSFLSANAIARFFSVARHHPAAASGLLLGRPKAGAQLAGEKTRGEIFTAISGAGERPRRSVVRGDGIGASSCDLHSRPVRHLARHARHRICG